MDGDKECVLRADEMALKSNLYYMLNKDEIIGFHQTYKTKSIILTSMHLF